MCFCSINCSFISKPIWNFPFSTVKILSILSGGEYAFGIPRRMAHEIVRTKVFFLISFLWFQINVRWQSSHLLNWTWKQKQVWEDQFWMQFIGLPCLYAEHSIEKRSVQTQREVSLRCYYFKWQCSKQGMTILDISRVNTWKFSFDNVLGFSPNIDIFNGRHQNVENKNESELTTIIL